MSLPILPPAHLERAIYWIRSQRVMLDEDLARIYGVTTKRLNEQVKRNAGRFPAGFVFQVSTGEARRLKSQFATSRTGRGGHRKLPYAFTEHGAVVLAAVLNMPRAIRACARVVQAFAHLRDAQEQAGIAPRPYRFTLYPPILAKA